MFGIGNRDNAIQAQALGEFGSLEGADDGAGVCQASRLNQHVIEALLLAEKFAEAFHQVAAHTAADAAVVKFKNFFVDADHQLVVDADRAEFVDHDGAFVPMILREDGVQQRCFAGP